MLLAYQNETISDIGGQKAKGGDAMNDEVKTKESDRVLASIVGDCATCAFNGRSECDDLGCMEGDAIRIAKHLAPERQAAEAMAEVLEAECKRCAYSLPCHKCKSAEQCGILISVRAYRKLMEERK